MNYEYSDEELDLMDKDMFPSSKSNKKTTKQPKKDDENIIYTSFLQTRDYILEQINNSELSEHSEHSAESQKSQFVKYSKLNGDFEYVNEFVEENRVFRPIVDDILLKGGVKLPSGVTEYKNTKEITDQIRTLLNENIELPSFYESLLPNLALFYWLYDVFPFIPYLGFIGGSGSGKTTAMNDFGSLCYKPIDTTGSLTIASMFRVATVWKGTLLIDEFYNVGEHANEIVAFLKAGVSDKLILRVEGEKKKEITAYTVKSPKIFTSEDPINDTGLNSRTLFVHMQKTKKEIPLYKLDDYYEEMADIRRKLLLFRLRNLNNIHLKDIKFGFPELKIFDRRIQQILTPIFYFSDQESRDRIIEFAKIQEDEVYRERRESLNGIIFDKLIQMWTIYQEAQIKDITKAINDEQGLKWQLTEKKVGNVIRKVLGFKTERGTGGLTHVLRDEAITAKQRSYFGYPLSEPSSLSSLTSLNSSTVDLEQEKTIKKAEELFTAKEEIPF